MSMLLMADLDDVLSDAGVTFQAYVMSRPIAPGGDLSPMGYVREAHLVAKPAASTTIRMTLYANFQERSTYSDVVLTPEAAELVVIPMFENMQEADITMAQVKLGDASAVASYWALVMLVLPGYEAGER